MSRFPLFVLPVALVAAVVLPHLFRSPSAVSAAEAVKADDASKPIKALLVIGGCCHDYEAQKKLLTEGISARTNVEWTVSYDPSGSTNKPNPIYKNSDWAKGFDVIVHDECSADVKDLELIDRILRPHRDGVPAVLLHCAMHSYRSEGYPDKDTPWFEFTGIATTAHGPHVPLTITYTDTEHPITRGLPNWTTGDEELYNNVRKPLPGTHALASGKQNDQEAVVVWTHSYGAKKTKVFGTTLGHHNATVSDARYLDLVTRGLLWSVGKLDDKHLKPLKDGKASSEADPAATTAAVDTGECNCDPLKR